MNLPTTNLAELKKTLSYFSETAQQSISAYQAESLSNFDNSAKQEIQKTINGMKLDLKMHGRSLSWTGNMNNKSIALTITDNLDGIVKSSENNGVITELPVRENPDGSISVILERGGIIKNKGKSFFQGSVNDDLKPHGRGAEYDKNGKKFISGIYQNGQLHGEGHIHAYNHPSEKGIIIDCMFNEGVLVKNTETGNTVLHNVKLLEKYKSLKELCLKLGVDVNAQNNIGLTPLVAAIKLGTDIETIKFLLVNGANINEQNSLRYGHAPLNAAIMKGNKEVVKLLIDNEVDIKEILSVAIMKGNKKVVELLIDNGADIQEILSVAMKENDLRTIASLIDAEAYINIEKLANKDPLANIEKNPRCRKVYENTVFHYLQNIFKYELEKSPSGEIKSILAHIKVGGNVHEISIKYPLTEREKNSLASLKKQFIADYKSPLMAAAKQTIIKSNPKVSKEISTEDVPQEMIDYLKIEGKTKSAKDFINLKSIIALLEK